VPAGVDSSVPVSAPANGQDPRPAQHRLRVLLGAVFRPDQPAERGGRVRVLAIGGALLVGGTALSLLRQPGPGALDTVWAEDGTIFLADALRYSTAEALGTSYAGYYHLVPRLLAEVATLVPLSWAAAALAVSAALVTTLLAVAVYAASRAYLPSRLLRVLVAAPVVVLPLGQEELANSIANLHWPALYAVFWMLLWDPPGRWPRAAAGLVAFLTAASDLLALVFVPLALARVVAVRGWRGRLVPCALAAGLVLQVLAKVLAESPRALSPNPDPVWAGAAYALRVVPLAVVGERWLGADVSARPAYLALVALAWLVVGAAGVLALRRVTRPARLLAALAAVHSVVLYVLSTMLSGLVVPRYAAAPALLLLVALAALVVPRADRPRTGRSAATVPATALAVLVAVVCVVNFRVPNPRAEGPGWTETVREGGRACAASAAAETDLPVTPAEWRARVPCPLLRD
jgi:hypothetical protein